MVLTETARENEMNKVEIFRDEYDGKYRIDFCPDSDIRDRRSQGFVRLADAKAFVEQREFQTGNQYQIKYVGKR